MPFDEQQTRPSLTTEICTNNQLYNLEQFLNYDQVLNSEKLHLSYKMRFKLFMSEFIGTFFLVYLSQTALTSFELLGTQNDIICRRLATILTYSLAYLVASLMTLNLSGAHLNPAYSLACASFGNLKWSRAIDYTIAQYLGSFFAAFFLYATYSDKLIQRHIEGLLTGMNSTLRAHGNILSTGKFFSSYPPTEVSLAQLTASYILATATLISVIHMIYESKLVRLPRSLRPFYLAAAHCLVQAAFSANGGPVINPAQDFSPRLYIYLFGWGSAAFSLYNYRYWWLCGVVAPHIGSLIGLAFYKALDHLRTIPDDSDNDDKAVDDGLGEAYLHRTYEHNYNHSRHDFLPKTTDNF